MVDLNSLLAPLNEVSDNCCEDNGKECIDFDKVDNNLATADCLIIKDGYFLLVEFKKLDEVEDINEWMNDKSKNQQILIKAYESYFLLKKLVKNFDKFEKRFVLVYKASKSKNKIKEHFKSKLSRIKIAYDEVLVLECKNFKNLLQRIENVF
ncbi:MAG: hypothetical protein ABGX23_01205 [Nautiliaceae bacterium]